MTKEVHEATGDLLLIPANGNDPVAYRVDLGSDRHAVRVYISAIEALCLKPGTYTPEIGESLGRPAIIFRGAYSPPSWRK